MIENSTNKQVLVLAAVVLLIVLAVTFFRGWTWAKYDKRDPNIGKEFVIVGSMVYLSNLTKFYAGKEIAKEFGGLIAPKFYWRRLKSRFSWIKDEDIPCTERFVIVEVLHLIPVGLIEMSTKTTLTYYVVESDKYPRTVIEEGNYEAYAKPVDHVGDGGDCVAPSVPGIN